MSPDPTTNPTEHADREVPAEPEAAPEVHGGHTLESGLLTRIRDWVDLFPWLRLTRVLRLAASPTLLLTTAAVGTLWLVGMLLLMPSAGNFFAASFFLNSAWWQSALLLAWTLFLFAPLAVVLSRQGGLLCAGRPMIEYPAALKLAIRRSPQAWLAAFLPLALTVACGLLLVPIGWLSQLFEGINAIQWLLAITAVLLAIPAGILLFGSLVAIPLSWAALANEQAADPLDSLSRGYEALFRRPLHLALYLAIATIFTAVVAALAVGILTAVSTIATVMISLSGGTLLVLAIAQTTAAQLVGVVVFTLVWGFIGGIYLLLRYDTCGQEVEDIWESQAPATRQLPELPVDN